jgi:transcription elongation factor
MQPSTADASLYQGAADTNYGTVINVETDMASGAMFRSIFSFDFSALVPTGATITSAILSLFHRSNYATGRTIAVYRLLRTDWVESQATWNSYKTGSAWGTAGCGNSTTDYTTTNGATAVTGAGAETMTWDVKAQVQTARDSVGGVAHFLLMDTGATGACDNTWRSKNYTDDPTLCPKLVIAYTAVSPNFIPFFWA